MKPSARLHQLRNFIAVTEAGSLRAAARNLNIAQPAVTRSIQELEKELGVPLFERRTRGVVPTAIGAAFMRRAKHATGELLRACDEIDQLRGMTHGSVCVAMSMVPHMALLPSILQPFRVRYPGVRLDLIDAVFSTVASRLSDGTIDCYIGPPPEAVPDGLVPSRAGARPAVCAARSAGAEAGSSGALRADVDRVDHFFRPAHDVADPVDEFPAHPRSPSDDRGHRNPPCAADLHRPACVLAAHTCG